MLSNTTVHKWLMEDAVVKPPTWGIEITLPREAGSISRGIGELRSSDN